MKTLTSKRGSAALAAIAATSIAAAAIVGGMQSASIARARELAKFSNQIEGFYVSEMAAWHNYTLAKSDSYPRRNRSTNSTTWDNTFFVQRTPNGQGRGDYGSGVSIIRESDDGRPLSLEQIASVDTALLVGVSNMTRRYTPNMSSYKPPQDRNSPNAVYCGRTNYGNGLPGTKACLVAAVPQPPPLPPCSGRYIAAGNPDQISASLNALGPRIVNNAGALRFDGPTAQRVCTMLGKPLLASFDSLHRDGRRNFTSPHNNYLVRWNEPTTTWITEGATGGQWLSSIECRCAGDI